MPSISSLALILSWPGLTLPWPGVTLPCSTVPTPYSTLPCPGLSPSHNTLPRHYPTLSYPAPALTCLILPLPGLILPCPTVCPYPTLSHSSLILPCPTLSFLTLLCPGFSLSGLNLPCGPKPNSEKYLNKTNYGFLFLNKKKMFYSKCFLVVKMILALKVYKWFFSSVLENFKNYSNFDFLYFLNVFMESFNF